MSGSLNKVQIKDMYSKGLSIPDISVITGFSMSGIRYQLKQSGILRNRTDAIMIAAKKGKLGGGNRGKKCPHTQETIDKITVKSIERGQNALGISHKKDGYVEYTKGINKHRSVHVVLFEERIGRKLLKDEIVHHIDGDKHNNDINNLALMTKSAHMKLHRKQGDI